MKISLNWLKDYIDFNPKHSIEEIAAKLTEATAAIDVIHDLQKGLDHVVVGEIVESKRIPETNHLNVAKVRVGKKEIIQIIHGDKAGISKGDKIPTAIAPCSLPCGKVEPRVFHGLQSQGMFCLDSELFPSTAEVLTKFSKTTPVGEPVAPFMLMDDVVFEIDNLALTHRSDLFSHLGFARECVALGLAKWKKQKPAKPEILLGKKPMPITPQFENGSLSKSYYSTVIEGLSDVRSPLWMSRRLEAVGIRSLNAIIDITNYVMMDVGQPCHAFDVEALKNKDFKVRLSRDGEVIKTLDGIDRHLPANCIVIESGQDIVDLCGIMGAENSATKQDTSSVYLHACHYDPVLIRRAMMKLSHRTEAGTIFEKNLELSRSQTGFLRALKLFNDIFPKAKFPYIAYSHHVEKSQQRKISFPLAYLAKHSGTDIPPKEVKQILSDLGFSHKINAKALTVTVPSWREFNIRIPEDVIEEIIRIHGYSKIKEAAPAVPLRTPLKNHELFLRRTVLSYFVRQGFWEESNLSLLSSSLLGKSGFTDFSPIAEVQNPVSDDYRWLRPSLLPYLLQNLGRNQLLEYTIWKTFELGKVFLKNGDKLNEVLRLSALVAVPDKSFFVMKGIVDGLLKELHIPVQWVSASSPFSYPGRCTTAVSGESVAGQIFEIHPKILDAFKIHGSVAVFEVSISVLGRIAFSESLYKPLNRHPPALLDLSVVVDAATPLAEVEQQIRSIEPKMLQKLTLHEVYEGQNLGKDKKSFLFSLSYQHPQRTLREEEIQSILKELIKTIEASGGLVRR